MLSCVTVTKGPLSLSAFDYSLPQELIARQPLPIRERSRLMLVDRATGRIEHHSFHRLPRLLEDTDLLVLNDTRVFPARLRARAGKRPLEIVLLREVETGVWEALIKPGHKAPVSTSLEFDDCDLKAEVIGTTGSSIRLIRFLEVRDFCKTLERIGRMPLPPYMKRSLEADSQLDRERYQTVFARHSGSVAAPTAGLHFTRDLLGRLEHVFLTLHVGYGTFQPVSTESVEEHEMDAEYYRLDIESAARIREQKSSGRRIVSVGSTSTRVLEQVFLSHGHICGSEAWTSLYIFPGFPFQVVDGLLTNFHLPRSTLFLLACAFAGTELMHEAYRLAVEQGYRFYSYGDAMLIL